MKLKNLLTFLAVLVSFTFSFSQAKRTYEPFGFENFQAVWQHTVIDTSIVGQLEDVDPITGDSIWYDGFSHFNDLRYFRVAPVIDGDKIVIVELNGGNYDCQGAFIQCLDSKSGKVLWQTAYDLRTENRNEYPERAYINKYGQLEVLGHRKDNTYHVSFFWLHSLMTVRKYNINTGELEERTIVDENDTLAKRMIIPYSTFLANKAGSYLFPYDDGYQYFIQAFGYTNNILDNDSHIIDSTIIEYDKEPDIVLDRTFLTKDDNFKQIRFFSSDYYDFPDDPDTFGLSYSMYDRNFNLLKHKKFENEIKHCHDYYVSYVDQDYFVMTGINYENFGDDTLKYVSYSTFDKNADLVEEFTLKNDDGSPFRFNHKLYSGVVLKLKDEPGLLIVASTKKEDGFDYLVFFKSNGLGDYKKLKELKVTGKNHELILRDIMYLSNGEIMLKALDNNYDLVDNGYVMQADYATVYICFSTESLGIKTNTKDYVQKTSIKIYPNPVSDNLKAEFPENFTGILEIVDESGKSVYKQKVQNSQIQNIDVSDFASGVYYVKLINKIQKNIYSSKAFIVK